MLQCSFSHKRCGSDFQWRVATTNHIIDLLYSNLDSSDLNSEGLHCHLWDALLRKKTTKVYKRICFKLYLILVGEIHWIPQLELTLAWFDWFQHAYVRLNWNWISAEYMIKTPLSKSKCVPHFDTNTCNESIGLFALSTPYTRQKHNMMNMYASDYSMCIINCTKISLQEHLIRVGN